MIDLKGPEVTQDLSLLAEVGVGHFDQRLRAGNQPNVFDWRRGHHLAQRADLFGNEIGQIYHRTRDTKESVEIGTAEVGVYQGNALITFGDRGRNVGRNHRFSNSAFAASDGPDARRCRPGLRKFFDHLGKPSPVPEKLFLRRNESGVGVTLII